MGDELAKHLIAVWFQYGGGYKNAAGVVRLPHHCMQAGENAGDWLESLGLATDNGWEWELSPEGMALFYEMFPA